MKPVSLVKVLREAETLPQEPCNLSAFEMNPAIARRFFSLVRHEPVPDKVWEPFAANDRFQDMAREIGIELLSFGMVEKGRVKKGDSTDEGPGAIVGGVLFHPPYFGSCLQSDDPADLSAITSVKTYRQALFDVAVRAWLSMPSGGMVCAVGRDYLHDRKRVNLSDWYSEEFWQSGFTLFKVWKSEPDVALLFRK